MNHPFFTPRAVWDAWVFHLKYQVLRVTQYHFADVPAFGWIAWALAVAPLCFSTTRRAAVVLWASVVSWMMIVALNGQVRWQNERYTMPAVAWLLLASTLGLAVLLSHAARARTRGSLALATLSVVATGSSWFISCRAFVSSCGSLVEPRATSWISTSLPGHSFGKIPRCGPSSCWWETPAPSLTPRTFPRST
jgi:cation transport ATPase